MAVAAAPSSPSLAFVSLWSVPSFRTSSSASLAASCAFFTVSRMASKAVFIAFSSALSSVAATPSAAMTPVAAPCRSIMPAQNMMPAPATMRNVSSQRPRVRFSGFIFGPCRWIGGF
jgi:hypothetical protein